MGISAASNDVENQIAAFVGNAAVTAAEGVAILATAATTIKALTIGGAVAVGVGGDGVGIAGAGAGSGNKVKNSILAYILNNSKIITSSGNVTLTAQARPRSRPTAVEWESP